MRGSDDPRREAGRDAEPESGAGTLEVHSRPGALRGQAATLASDFVHTGPTEVFNATWRAARGRREGARGPRGPLPVVHDAEGARRQGKHGSTWQRTAGDGRRPVLRPGLHGV